MNISQAFDQLLRTELAKRLGREPLPNEVVNADNDSDLVNEILWELVFNLNDRVTKLEQKTGVVTPTTITPPPTET